MSKVRRVYVEKKEDYQLRVLIFIKQKKMVLY